MTWWQKILDATTEMDSYAKSGKGVTKAKPEKSTKKKGKK